MVEHFVTSGAFYLIATVRVAFGLVLISVASVSRAPKTLPSLGLSHLDRWDRDGSDGRGGNGTCSCPHRMVVAAGIRRRPSRGRCSSGPRGLRGIRLRSRSTRCLTGAAPDGAEEGLSLFEGSRSAPRVSADALGCAIPTLTTEQPGDIAGAGSQQEERPQEQMVLTVRWAASILATRDWLDCRRSATSVCVRPSRSRRRRRPSANASLTSTNRRSSADNPRKSPIAHGPSGLFQLASSIGAHHRLPSFHSPPVGRRPIACGTRPESARASRPSSSSRITIACGATWYMIRQFTCPSTILSS